MSRIAEMHKAKIGKNDEFYTQLKVINDEMMHYRDYFKGKSVYCNCDDPRVSNFFYYFSEQFESLGLKQLITTCYKNSKIDLFSKHEEEKAVYLVYDGDKNKNKKVDDDEISVKPLKGNGDFRSDECIAMLKKADIVCTNPPFSLFRDYIAQLMEYDKKFLVIGNVNSIIMKEIFPYIMANKLWLGPSITSGDREFGVPDSYPLNAASSRVENGKKFIRVKGVRWWTNIDHHRRHQELDPTSRYYDNKKLYPKYDNYDAIEVGKVKDIPCDYDGVMGVPITFLDKYNPDEFEVLGCTQRGCHDKVPDTKRYDTYKEMKPDGTPTGSSGGKTNENANVTGNDGKKNFFTNGKHIIQSKYGRLFVRYKNVKRRK